MKTKAYGVCVYKHTENGIHILLCKSSISNQKWGFLKGVQEKFETKESTAIREFQEESSIIINKNNLEKYFEQINEEKDIGIYLVNYETIYNVEQFFDKEQLYPKYLSWENSEVKFFNITKLPKIKKKQHHMVQEIKEYLLLHE